MMRGVFVPFLGIALAACGGQSADGHEVAVRVIASGLQCGRTEDVSIAEIRSSEEFNVWLPDFASADMATIFDRERVFVIDMGGRATAGYGLSLARPYARLEHGTVTVALNWQAPAPGAFAAQVITHPCLVVSLEKHPYTDLRIVDQNGAERARLALR